MAVSAPLLIVSPIVVLIAPQIAWLTIVVLVGLLRAIEAFAREQRP